MFSLKRYESFIKESYRNWDNILFGKLNVPSHTTDSGEYRSYVPGYSTDIHWFDESDRGGADKLYKSSMDLAYELKDNVIKHLGDNRDIINMAGLTWQDHSEMYRSWRDSERWIITEIGGVYDKIQVESFETYEIQGEYDDDDDDDDDDDGGWNLRLSYFNKSGLKFISIGFHGTDDPDDYNMESFYDDDYLLINKNDLEEFIETYAPSYEIELINP